MTKVDDAGDGAGDVRAADATGIANSARSLLSLAPGRTGAVANNSSVTCRTSCMMESRIGHTIEHGVKHRMNIKRNIELSRR